MRKNCGYIIVLVMLLFLVPNAYSEEVRFHFEGLITDFSETDDFTQGTIEEGNQFTGFVSYNSSNMTEIGNSTIDSGNFWSSYKGSGQISVLINDQIYYTDDTNPSGLNIWNSVTSYNGSFSEEATIYSENVLVSAPFVSDSSYNARVSLYNSDNESSSPILENNNANINQDNSEWQLGNLEINTLTSENKGFQMYGSITDISFVPETPDPYDPQTYTSLLFREAEGAAGNWIPGWDHMGLNFDNLVYESHPEYSFGTYVDSTGQESAYLESIDGLQSQHTVGTFLHDSQTATSTIGDYLEIEIDSDLAKLMVDEYEKLENIEHHSFQYLGGLGVIDEFSDIQDFYATLNPSSQKGGDGTFTCVGLVESLAEQAGHNLGQGFIPNSLETIGGVANIPFLSPWLLSVFADPLNFSNYPDFFSDLGASLTDMLLGFFDPVDFILTDPLGRRFGYTDELGYLNEIPDAFYSGDGFMEYFMILNSLSGDYSLEFFGLEGDALAYVGNYNEIFFEFDNYLNAGQYIQSSFNVSAPVPEPATMLLFGTGLIGLVGISIRRRKK